MVNPQSISGSDSDRGANSEACSLRRQLSWSDFDSLERQMATRIVTLERHVETLEHHLPSVESGERLCLRGGDDDGVVVGDDINEEERKFHRTVTSFNGANDSQQCETKNVPSNEMRRRQSRRFSLLNAANAESSSMYDGDGLVMYELPESTFTMLTTEKITSVGFAIGIIAAALSVTCLALAFKNEIDNEKPGNRLGLPWDVRTEVRVAQYLGKSFHVKQPHQNLGTLVFMSKPNFLLKHFTVPALLIGEYYLDIAPF
jgi:hypothetical protein